MQFVRQVKRAQSCSEVQKIIVQAKLSNELSSVLINEAIRKFASRDCKNVKLGHELSRQIPVHALPFVDRYTLECMLTCSSQVYDFNLAHQAFRLLKNPNSYDFYYYVASFKEAKAEELSREIIEELGSLWQKAEQLGRVENDKLLNQLFSVLSFSKEKQCNLITQVISKPPVSTFTCGLVGNFIKFCLKNHELDLAKKVLVWSESIRERERGTFGYFLITFQYYSLFPPPIADLKNLWSQVKNSGFHGRAELVNSMCKALASNKVEQRNFITDTLCYKPNESFHCDLLGGFLKHCSEVKDVDLAKEIWDWGQCFKDREMRGGDSILVAFQYMRLCESITEQEKYILDRISRPIPTSYHCSIIGCFLTFCHDEKNLQLAKRVWTWGLGIRKRCRGTTDLCKVTIQYLSICKVSGDLALLEEIWGEAKEFKVASFKEALGAFMKALTVNGDAERVLEEFNNIPSENVDDYILNATLSALSQHDRIFEALSLLRRFQTENPKIVSILSYKPVIVAFVRNGYFQNALSLIEEGKKFGIHPDLIIWKSFLGPCREFRNLAVALMAFDEIQKVEHEPDDIIAAKVSLAGVYKWCGDKDTFRKISKSVRKSKGADVQLSISQSESLSFHERDLPSNVEPEIANDILEVLEGWISNLKGMELSDESVNGADIELSSLAYSIEIPKFTNLFNGGDNYVTTLKISKFIRAPILLNHESRVHFIRNGVCSLDYSL